ncbi:hypothetical protein H2199_006253 [Coniosporium tulheliwenetii]|uniref:Uncharacterized protein n=1 Tax=Coniosporium tulheliwenetii TaxID=3383036 RepID=A0ACC2YX66_9PEZI|nr:hypothetical protein H2199_006253 [Cladosporium sp. JES 115]
MTPTRLRRPLISRKLLLLILTALALLTILALALGLGLGFGLKPDPPVIIPPTSGTAARSRTPLSRSWDIRILSRCCMAMCSMRRSLFYISNSSHLQEIYTDAPYNFQEAWRWYPRNTGGVSLYDLQLLASPNSALAACAYAIDNSTSEVRLFYGGDDGRILQAGLRNGGWEYLGPIHGGQRIRVGEVEMVPSARGGMACTSGSDFAGLTLYEYGVAGEADEVEGALEDGARLRNPHLRIKHEPPPPLAALSGTLASAANTTADTLVYALPAPVNDTSAADPASPPAGEPGLYFLDLARSVSDVGTSGRSSSTGNGGASSPAAAILIAALQSLSNMSTTSNASSSSTPSTLSPFLLTRGTTLHQTYLPGTGLAAAWMSDEGGGGRELLVLFRNGSAVLSQAIGTDGFDDSYRVHDIQAFGH